MAFDVSYVFKAIDQFSGVAKKIKRSLEGVRSKTKDVSVQVGKMGRAFVTKFKSRAKFAIDSVKRGLTSLSDASRRLSKTLGMMGTKLLVVATLPIGFLAKGLIQAASDAQETRSKFNTVFSDIRSESNATADALAKNFGLSGTKAREFLGDTGDLLTGFGFTGKSALDLSNRVAELGVDLASFTNFSGGAEGATASLAKAMLGETESLKSLGIAILQEDVKKKVKQLILVDKMTFATLRQAKAYATLMLATEQSKNAIGDYNRTSQDYVNKARLMDSRTQDLKESLGNILLPVALKIVLALTKLIEKFEALNPATKKNILIIGGVVAALGPLLIGLGLLVAIMPLVGAGFSIMFGPIGLAVMAIAALAFVVYKNFDAIQLIVADSIDYVIGKFDLLVNTFKNSDIGGTLIKTAQSIKGMWSSVFASIKGPLTGYVQFIVGMWGSILDSIMGYAQIIIGMWSSVFASIKAPLLRYAKSIIGMWSSILDFFVAGWNLIGTLASIAFDSVKNTFIIPLMEAFSPVTDLLSNIFEPLETSFSGVLDAMILKFADFIGGLFGGLASIADYIGSIFSGGTEKLNEINKSLKENHGITVSVDKDQINTILNSKNVVVLDSVRSNAELTNPKPASSFGEANQSSKPASSFGATTNQSSIPDGSKLSSITEAPRVKIEVAIKDASGKAVSSTSTLISGDAELNTGKNLVGMA